MSECRRMKDMEFKWKLQGENRQWKKNVGAKGNLYKKVELRNL